MKKQTNMQQMKEHGKKPQDQTSEEEIGSLPAKEFRVMIVKMIQDLRNRMELWIEKIREKFNKDLEMNKTITKMKNALKESIAE